MPNRVIAIGDIHGYLAALDALLAAVEPQPNDTIVTLGDYGDRGPDARGVIDRLIALKEQCRAVSILGNHDELLLKICRGQSEWVEGWLLYGGDATVASYGGRVPEGIPPAHAEFLDQCRDWYETEHHFFAHGNYHANSTLKQQPWEQLRWESLRERQPLPHLSGKTAVVGHTAQKTGEILDLGHLKCIDTWIYGDGWLTAMDVEGGQVWQADQDGKLRGK